MSTEPTVKHYTHGKGHQSNNTQPHYTILETTCHCTTNRVDLIDIFLSLIILSLDPVSVQVLTNTIQYSTRELVVHPDSSVELENEVTH